MTREICKACWRPSPVGFLVPDEVWLSVKPDGLPGDVLCIMCFATLADEAGIAWDKQIEFYPVSLRTHAQYDWEPIDSQSRDATAA